MRCLIVAVLFFVSAQICGQDYNEKRRYLLWTFHTQNTTINGISLGAFPQFNYKERYVKTNGIRLELPGIGFLGFLANGSMIRNEKTNEIVNGINISSGTIGEVMYNGITIGGVVQCGTTNNGLAIAGMWNAMALSNGIQIAGLLNEAKYSRGIQIAISNETNLMKGLQIGGANYANEQMAGVQIGVYNFSTNTRGIQIGIWNVNEKRKWPIINWHFGN